MRAAADSALIVTQSREPHWLDRLDEGLALARTLGRPVAVKPTGQGYGRCDDW